MPIKRKYYTTGYQHICQITVDGGLCFCAVSDYILLYTLICIKALEYGVNILCITIMFNHFHIEAQFPSVAVMSDFMHDVTLIFAKHYNAKYGVRGQLFKRPFKSSPKYSEDDVVENFVYIGNNAKKKKAVTRGEEYRWGFLKYMVSDHPFSDEFRPLEASGDMIYLVKKVKAMRMEGKPIGYKFFASKKCRNLNDRERQQLVDIIISTYNIIDYDKAIELFGSYERMCNALNVIQGHEYGCCDDVEREDYRHYPKMIRICEEEGYDLREKRYNGVVSVDKVQTAVGKMSIEMAERLSRRFKNDVGASEKECRKFLHWF